MGLFKQMTGKTLRRRVTGKPGDLEEFKEDAIVIGKPVVVTPQHVVGVFTHPHGDFDRIYLDRRQVKYVCGDVEFTLKTPSCLRGSPFEGEAFETRAIMGADIFLEGQHAEHFSGSEFRVERRDREYIRDGKSYSSYGGASQNAFP